MIPILQSPLVIYFRDMASRNEDIRDVYFLERVEAVRAWQHHVDEFAKGLHDLPNTSWVIRAHWEIVGDWIAAYNGMADATEVPKCISKKSNWAPNEPLLLIQSRENIVSVTFDQFSKYWEVLLAAFDDGPLLMSKAETSSDVFSFVPLGNILYSNVKNTRHKLG